MSRPGLFSSRRIEPLDCFLAQHRLFSPQHRLFTAVRLARFPLLTKNRTALMGRRSLMQVLSCISLSVVIS
jgi:hypothetical protein